MKPCVRIEVFDVGRDSVLPAHFLLMPRSPQSLPDSGNEGRGARVALVTSDYDGPRVCGGVGSAFAGLAEALAAAGHEVHIAYVARAIDVGTEHEWQERLGEEGIGFSFVPYAGAEANYHWLQNRKEASFLAYQWLARQPHFDVVHFPEWLGLGYYSLLAKQQGLAFDRTTIVVGTHGPQRWSRPSEGRLANGPDDLVTDHLERRSAELADVVVSPSAYLLEWLEEDGWALPERRYVEQNLLSLRSFGGLEPRTAGSPIDELVFFGRLDRRKGLDLFLDAVDLLHARGLTPKVTFLGADARFDNKELSSLKIEKHAERWPRPADVLLGRSREQALRYLLGDGRLAVMPSRIDNSPCTIQECLLLGIPFVTSAVGGIPELVSTEDAERVLCSLDPHSLADRLARALSEPSLGASMATVAGKTRRRWTRWHATEADRLDSTAVSTKRVDCLQPEAPRVSVCIAHWERPDLLEQMVDSLKEQSYPRLEVVVVDDGSTNPETLERLTALEADFADRGWRLERQANAGPGAARNRAAESARGEVLLFADDDDVLVPRAVEEMVRTALVTGADVVTCGLAEFEGTEPPGPETRVTQRLLPLGTALAPGLISPELGGTFILLRPEVFHGIGGFREERNIDEDWELLLDAAFAGHQLDVVPETLVWYRKLPGSRSRADNRQQRLQSRLKKYERALPIELRGIVELAFANTETLADAYRVARLRDMLQRRHEASLQQKTAR
ncbi:MAG: glycosyltransferase [Acidobacteriota bacterium]